LHHAEADDQTNGPNTHKGQERDRAEEAEEGLARFVRREQPGRRLPGGPSQEVIEARQAEFPGHAARQDDRFKSVPCDDQKDNYA
jgi:hypothetical protein